jgi:tetratricopeptide (TPR) repeat protein
VLLGIGFLVVIALSNHAPEGRTPEGLEIVADDATYTRALDIAKELSSSALQNYEEGKQLTAEETKNIRQAVKWIDEANLYRPEVVAPYFLSGKAHAALGDYAKADEKLRQGLANVGSNKSQQIVLASIDAHYERSRVLFALGDYQGAYSEGTIAALAIPNDPDYLIARAKAALQINRMDVAKEEVAAAVAISPDHPGVKMLEKYLNVSPTSHPGKLSGTRP